MQFFVLGDTERRRRFYFFLVDEGDGKTPELGEADGQPQISINGDAFVNTDNLLVSVGFGKYYVLLTTTEAGQVGKILGRYKSANTIEFTDVGHVVLLDIYGSQLARTFGNTEYIRWNLPKRAEAENLAKSIATPPEK